MKNAAAFRASYADWKLIKTRNVIQIIFEIPLEDHDSAYQALGGMPDQSTARWFAIARLTDGVGAPPAPREADTLDQSVPASRSNTDGATAEASREAERSKAPRQPSASRSYNLAQQAAICCNDLLFQSFLGGTIRDLDVDSARAAELVRNHCHVSSRSEIRPGTDAATRWHDLHSEFVAWRDNPDLVEDHTPLNDCQSERVG